MAFPLSCTSRFLAYIWRAEIIIIPCLFVHSIIPKNIETSTQKHRFIQCNLIIKHKVSVHLRMNFLLQLFSSTPCNWTSYIKCSFIWSWVNARNILITGSRYCSLWLLRVLLLKCQHQWEVLKKSHWKRSRCRKYNNIDLGYEKANSLHNLMFWFLTRTLTHQVITISRMPNWLQF
jgi:hypothetical protein